MLVTLDHGCYSRRLWKRAVYGCTLQKIVIFLKVMKQYVIDELRPEDYEKIKAYLDENFGSSGVDGIYWMPLDISILTDVQAEHTKCQPFYFAIDIEQNRMACELLVRTRSRVRCNCISYATENQLIWLIRIVDAIFEKLGIIT